MDTSADIVYITEYIHNCFYFAITKSDKILKSTDNIHYFSTDNELTYENYYSDFGPLNLACVYKYCIKVSHKLKSHLSKQKIVYYTSSDPKKKSNAAFLIGCYGVLFLCLSPKEAYKPLILHGQSYKCFQDAVQGESNYTITLLDCLYAMKKAREIGLFNFQDFDLAEYERLSNIQGGDLNWIVPGKFMAFIGPVDCTISLYHPPEIYVDYFLQNNVSIVIRLNKKFYDGYIFEASGITHYDLFFPDGSCPPRHILLQFLQISEDSKNDAIAVHCKAGLGRTGSLIGSYLIKHYRLTAREAIAWMRICRPGSVIGHQQAWLEQLESWLHRQGNMFRKRNYGDTNKVPRHQFGIYSIVERDIKDSLRAKFEHNMPPSFVGKPQQATSQSAHQKEHCCPHLPFQPKTPISHLSLSHIESSTDMESILRSPFGGDKSPIPGDFSYSLFKESMKTPRSTSARTELKPPVSYQRRNSGIREVYNPNHRLNAAAAQPQTFHQKPTVMPAETRCSTQNKFETRSTQNKFETRSNTQSKSRYQACTERHNGSAPPLSASTAAAAKPNLRGLLAASAKTPQTFVGKEGAMNKILKTKKKFTLKEDPRIHPVTGSENIPDTDGRTANIADVGAQKASFVMSNMASYISRTDMMAARNRMPKYFNPKVPDNLIPKRTPNVVVDKSQYGRPPTRQKTPNSIVANPSRKPSGASSGAGSTGACSQASSVLSPSVRSDNPRYYTQGDVLNSIKFERLMRQGTCKAARTTRAEPLNLSQCPNQKVIPSSKNTTVTQKTRQETSTATSSREAAKKVLLTQRPLKKVSNF